MIWSFRTSGNYVEFVHIEETVLQNEQVVHRLHNTSRCVDWSLPEDTTRISFTIDEIRYENVLITDIDFDGSVMNEQADFETGIIAMFTGLSGGSPGGSSYLVYTAKVTIEEMLSQTSGVLVIGNSYLITTVLGDDDFSNVGYVSNNIPFTASATTPTEWSNETVVYKLTDSAPTVDVMNNTIGAIVWTRRNATNIRGTLAGAFTENKTTIDSEIDAFLTLSATASFTGWVNENQINYQADSEGSVGYIWVEVYS